MAATAELRIEAQDHTRQAFAAVKKNIDGVTHHLRSLKGELLALAGVAGFGALMESAIDAGASIEKLSKKLGTSTEALSQFKYVAEVSHVSFDSLTRSWQFLEKNVAAASLGLGPAKNAFEALGLSAARLKKLRIEEQFNLLSDAFTHVHNAADRTRLAMQIFGKAGAEMIPLLMGGSKALNAARLEADRLGLTLSETAAHDMAGAHEAIIRLKSAMMGIANTLAVQFAPALASVAEHLSTLLPKAIQGVIIALLRLKEAAALALSSVLLGLSKLYAALGHLPGTLGQPFREASLAAKDFQETLFKTVRGYEASLASLKTIEVPIKPLVDNPTANLLSSEDMLNSHQHAMSLIEKTTEHALKIQQKMLETHVQKITQTFSSGFFSFMETGFKGMVQSFKNSLQIMASDAAATELASAIFKNSTHSPQHLLVSLLGSKIPNLLNSVFGGFKASGGEVLSGKGYIVGERGPEYFVPKQNGQIVPNHALGSTAPISIVMHIKTPDAGSFKRSTGQISTALGVALQQAVKRHT